MIHTVFVIAYLGVLLGVGALKASKIESQADFSLAGRGLSTPVLIGTLLATWIGTGSIFGNAEETFQVGAPAFLLPIPGVLGIMALWYLAPRVRKFESFTVQDILHERFGPACRIIGCTTLVLAYVIIVSYQYRAGAAVVGRVWPDLSHTAAVFLVAFFVIAYTALAGMYSVAYTDVANGVMMTVGIVIALPVLVQSAGGVSAILESLEPAKRHVLGHYSGPHLLSILLPSFLLLLGDANMYQRFLSARDGKSARNSALGLLVGVIFLESAIIATALVATALVAQGKVAAPENAGHIIIHVGFTALPPLLGAALVATVVAIIVSTADSYLLAPATSLVRDIYQTFLNPKAREEQIVRLSRTLVVVLGLIALVLAFASKEFFSVSLFAYTLYGASVTPAIVAALLWEGARPRAACASMIMGLVTAITWKICLSQGLITMGGRIDAVIPATAASIAVLVFGSLIECRMDPRSDPVAKIL